MFENIQLEVNSVFKTVVIFQIYDMLYVFERKTLWTDIKKSFKDTQDFLSTDNKGNNFFFSC